MPDDKIVRTDRVDEGTILACRLIGHTADGPIGCQTNGQRSPGLRPVAWPRVARLGIEPRADLRENGFVFGLKPSSCMKPGRKQRCLMRLETDPSRDSIGALCDTSEVAGHPVLSDAAVGIRCEEDAVGMATFNKPFRGSVHGDTSGPARRCRRIRSFDQAQGPRQRRKRSNHIAGVVGAVVCKQNDAEAAGVESDLRSQGRETAFDPGALVADWNGDHNPRGRARCL
ncbi:hypothetical protein RHAL1_00806 [Beijerinckiaceae bacterium RH AL1]|nr:hypothetical protein RHAL8_00774 [Beijerinckiaceae bacterium RH AL8]VVB43603.1 hypothetical protein RHCH11_RHCH11_00776 [Beijerinckiaceae bacterium RH CH11]VVC53915.1 hypothetical protein RHAL1_00806 [Beijerinckiaceae bacterium RH AL1]